MKNFIHKSVKTIILFSIFFSLFSAKAQAPQKMSYQAVIRNTSNLLVASTPVAIKVSILQSSASGTAVFVERHTPTTNVNGLATFEIGTGTILSGSFSAIDWANGQYFVKTETDPAGGTNYTIVGTSQLTSVPYALNSLDNKWSNNATGINYNFANVGIGTNSPAAKLDVLGGNWNLTGTSAGDFRVGNPTNNFKLGVATAGGGAGHTTMTSSLILSLGTGTTDPNVRTLNIAGGKVGIGTISPDFPLSFPTTYGEKISLWGNATNRVGFAVQPGNFQMLSDVSGTDITFGYGLSATPIEQMRIKGNTGNVGIGTATPTNKLSVFNQTGAGLLELKSAVSSTQITMDDSGLNDVYLSTTQGNFDIWTGGNNKRLSILTNGNIGVGIDAPTTKLEVNGFTKLGTDAPAIKVKKLTGTTGAAQNESISIAHGLTDSKILSVTVLVEYLTGAFVPASYSRSGYEFDFFMGGGNIYIWNSATNSNSILSKPIKIMVTYEE